MFFRSNYSEQTAISSCIFHSFILLLFLYVLDQSSIVDYNITKQSDGRMEEYYNMSADKTNVMRILDQKKIKYKVHEYKDSGAVSGVEVAAALGQDPKRAFKTLVTIGKSGNHYVFMVPVAEELDLKKAAKSVGEKNIEMIKSKELLPLTGYIHGGCSPVGMKKFFKTMIDKSVMDIDDTIFFSAGKIGFQVETMYDELKKVIRVEEADIVVD